MPILLLVVATVFWGASFFSIKIALQEISPISFIFLRFFVASLCMLPSLFYHPTRLTSKDIVGGTQLGLLLGGIMFLQTIGLRTITASVSAFLTGFAVVFVLAIRFVTQKKPPSFLDVATSLTCIFGLALVTKSHGVTWEPGVLYTLGSAFLLALYIYGLAAYAGRGRVLLLTILQMITLALLAGLSALLLEGNVQIPTKTATWTAILFCAVFCSALGFAIQAYAQQHISAFKASMILTLEPVFATFFSWLFLQEALSPSFYIGAAMILGAIVVINWRLQVLDDTNTLTDSGPL